MFPKEFIRNPELNYSKIHLILTIIFYDHYIIRFLLHNNTKLSKIKLTKDSSR